MKSPLFHGFFSFSSEFPWLLPCTPNSAGPDLGRLHLAFRAAAALCTGGLRPLCAVFGGHPDGKISEVVAG